MTLKELKWYFDYIEKTDLPCISIFYFFRELIDDFDTEPYCYGIRIWYDKKINKFYLDEKNYFDSFNDFVERFTFDNGKKIDEVLEDIDVDI